ncbi:MAG: hypothetical protein WCA84_01215 [Ignavibacteriaceae bacterium]
MINQKYISPTEVLVNKFLETANKFNPNVDLIQVLKARVYKISYANVLVRAASRPTNNNRKYFFGLNYITVEEMANLYNPYIAFICGDINNILILPANILFNNLNKISHDRNGEFKINIDKDLNISLKGRNNKLNCSEYINAWHLLNEVNNLSNVKNSVEESFHSVIQGRLLEIGNIRGFQTFCPNKSKQFNGKLLSEISTIKTCPELQFSDYDLLRQIDVLWFREKGYHLIPEYAFEIELSTGTWSGVGRMSTLLDYSNTQLFVISDDEKKYKKVINSLPLLTERYKHIRTDLISDLYSAELQLKELRYGIGL